MLSAYLYHAQHDLTPVEALRYIIRTPRNFVFVPARGVCTTEVAMCSAGRADFVSSWLTIARVLYGGARNFDTLSVLSLLCGTR